jgi:hypothetical protein
MKKLFLIAVLLLSVSLTYAQFNFGIKAGYNSSLSFSNVSSVTNGTYNLNSVQNELWNDFHAGLFARVGLGKKLYIQPELLYNIQKKNYNLTIQDAISGQVTLNKIANINTVEVPILVGYKLLDLKILNLRAFAGPDIKFNAGSSLEFNKITSGNFDTKSLVSDIKAANLGLQIGAGVDVLMFALDVKYTLIGDMYTTKLANVSLTNLPPSTFVISLGWKLF